MLHELIYYDYWSSLWAKRHWRNNHRFICFMNWNNMCIQPHFAQKGLGEIITGIFALWTEIIYLFELTLREKALVQNSKLYFLHELKHYVYTRLLCAKGPWCNNNSYISFLNWMIILIWDQFVWKGLGTIITVKFDLCTEIICLFKLNFHEKALAQ